MFDSYFFCCIIIYLEFTFCSGTLVQNNHDCILFFYARHSQSLILLIKKLSAYSINVNCLTHFFSTDEDNIKLFIWIKGFNSAVLGFLILLPQLSVCLSVHSKTKKTGLGFLFYLKPKKKKKRSTKQTNRLEEQNEEQ